MTTLDLFVSAKFMVDLVFFGFAVGYVTRDRAATPALTPAVAPIRDAIYLRIAVHEAGHAILAWANPYVSSIERIEVGIDLLDRKGQVLYVTSAKYVGRPDKRWFELATHLAGIAAELAELGNTRSGNAQADLQKAIDAARGLVADGSVEPPWEEDRGIVGFDPTRMFRNTSPDEARVLRLAFSRARGVIARDRPRFERVVHELCEHGTLDGRGVERVFGRRPMGLQ